MHDRTAHLGTSGVVWTQDDGDLVEGVVVCRNITSWPLLLLLLSGCRGEQQTGPQADRRVPAMDLTSTVFQEGATIPKAYTGDGQDVSPPLRWSGAPENTQSFALICDDPDAPRKEPWVHWVLFNW